MIGPILEPNPITAVAAPPTSIALSEDPVLSASPVTAGAILSNINLIVILNAIKPIPTFIAEAIHSEIGLPSAAIKIKNIIGIKIKFPKSLINCVINSICDSFYRYSLARKPIFQAI